MNKFLSLLLLLPVFVCAGCKKAESETSRTDPARIQYPIQIVGTTGMVADIVRIVGGEHVEVAQLLGSGIDPHLYKTTRDDVKKLINADVIFYSGLMLEGKMSDTLVKMARNKPVFAVTELVEESQLLEPEDFAGHYDPHLWNDVSAWILCVEAVCDALGKHDPSHADSYLANAEKYQAELKSLHEYGLKVIGSVPEKSRLLITSHDAFNYFGRAYGLEVRGVQGISTESEAGLQGINQLVDLLVARKVQSVFIESSVSSKNIKALIEGAASKKHTVVIGGELFSDAMGEQGTYEGTYIGMLDHNITLVARALGGDAPEKGFNGKLSLHAKTLEK